MSLSFRNRNGRPRTPPDDSSEGWYFSFACGLKDGVEVSGEWKTDGVDVAISVKTSGKKGDEPKILWHKQGLGLPIGWDKHLVDVSDYEGQTVDLAVTVSAGKSQNANFDWFVLAEPCINRGFEPALTLKDFTIKKQTAVMSDGGKVTHIAREEFGSRIFTGSFSSDGHTKEGVYIHPPFKNNVRGATVLTLQGVKIGGKASGKDAHSDML